MCVCMDASMCVYGCINVCVCGCINVCVCGCINVCVWCRRGGQGLRGLAASVLAVELDKSWRLRCSDWETEHLSQQQVKHVCTVTLAL